MEMEKRLAVQKNDCLKQSEDMQARMFATYRLGRTMNEPVSMETRQKEY
jgi:hypothetical protein